MKITRVKSERNVKGGQFYIRAVVNYQGDHWIEVFRIVGKAFNTESKHMPGHRKLKTVRGRYKNESYTSDLGIGRKGGFLFEYSNKVHNYLKSLSKREFNDVVNCTSLNDAEWYAQLSDWKFQKEMDDMFIEGTRITEEVESGKKFDNKLNIILVK